MWSPSTEHRIRKHSVWHHTLHIWSLPEPGTLLCVSWAKIPSSFLEAIAENKDMGFLINLHGNVGEGKRSVHTPFWPLSSQKATCHPAMDSGHNPYSSHPCAFIKPSHASTQRELLVVAARSDNPLSTVSPLASYQLPAALSLSPPPGPCQSVINN